MMGRKQQRSMKDVVRFTGKILIHGFARSLGATLGKLLLALLPHLMFVVGIMIGISMLIAVFFTPIQAATGLFNFTSEPSMEGNFTLNKQLQERYIKASDSTVDANKAIQHPDMNAFKVQWGLLAAIDKVTNNSEKPEPEAYAQVLKPIFTFKNMVKTTTVTESPGGSSTTKENVEVVDHVDTWQGRFNYNYEMVTSSTVSYRTETVSSVDSQGNPTTDTITITVTTTITEPQLLSIDDPMPKDYSKIMTFLKGKNIVSVTDVQFVLMLAKNYQTGGGVDVTDYHELVDLTGGYGETGYGAPPPSEWTPYFRDAAEKYHGSTNVGQFEALLMAICYTESSFSDARTVISSAGALGPMQIMPSTFEEYGVQMLGYRPDDIWNAPRAIMTAGLFESVKGANQGSIDGIRSALFAYNQSDEYVNKVISLMYFYGMYTGWTPSGGVPNANGYVWPVPGNYQITDPFGPRINPYTKQAGFHTGMDIGAPYGAPIVAAKSGTIVSITRDDPAYGVSITIDHGDGTTTFYGHMYEVNDGITIGKHVSAGDPIAPVGSNGFSTGPHLHFEIRVNGKPINPALIVTPN